MKNKEYDSLREYERFDFSTIDVDYLRTLPVLQNWLLTHPHATTVVNNDPVGHDEAPPGYPTHYRRKLEYRNGTIYVIPDPLNFSSVIVEYLKKNKYIPEVSYNFCTHEYDERSRYNKYYVVCQSDCKKMFKPLPFDCLRMELWECDTYYWYSGYKAFNGIFTWPKTKWDDKVPHPDIDSRWKEEIIAEKMAEYHLAKSAQESEWNQQFKMWVRPDNHMAVHFIRKFFPDYQPNEKLIKNYKDSSAWEYIEPYRWYYTYATLDDQYADPHFRINHKMPRDKEGAIWK
jgi:hypothetical protein